MELSDFIVIILGALIIIGAMALWFWNHTARQIHHLRKMETAVAKKMEIRRDVIPYLLEMYKDHVATQSTVFEEIVTVRAKARVAKDFKNLWAREEELEHHLEELYSEVKKNVELSNDIGWVEAKTELDKMEEELLKAEEDYMRLHDSLELRSRQLPYSLVGGYIRQRL